MAEQPSITSILAALAAQRPNASPAPNQQSTYQSQPQQQNLYPPSAGYPLPQPTNSGSVDLSNIKPVNSGTVSITDAIAKAKAIAARNGVSYEPPSSYGTDSHRPYSSRTRSQSPPTRREAFRDNFNPYRDERRGDRVPQSREYRERSYSPGPRGRAPTGAFSPVHAGGSSGGGYAFREHSPARGQDDNFESISIESNLVGLIIGRSGENLRRVEAETGCRVQFITGPDETGPYRQCKITGTRARRNDAKAEITRIINDSGMAGVRPAPERSSREPAPAARASSHQPALRDGEDSMQIMVPDRTVGLIIGRGGETIRDLQERSGCHINIVGEQKSVNGLRPVNLIGSIEAAALAKDLIMEIVESDSRNAASKERNQPQKEPASSGYGAGAGAGGGDKITDSIFVPSDAVGMIIGKGGETIKDMQSTTGCKINVSPSSGPGEVEREIGLVGSRDAIAAAKRAIEDKVNAVQQKNGGGRARAPQNDYSDRSFAQQSSYEPHTQPQNQAGAAADPYAPYGGYDAYVALWYQAMAAQQGGQAQDSSRPPGTS